MPTRTKAELLAENERLQKRVAVLERAKARSAAASKEVRQLRAYLRESEQQQTATADILRIISSSPTDTQPVFDAVAESAARLCEAHDVVIRLVGADGHYAVAHHGPIPVIPPHVLTRATPGGRAIIDARTVHIPDVGEAHVREEYPESRASATGQRTFLAVPLLREGKAIGLIVMRRPEVRPFSDNQIQLLETFAAQAVIAIENARLFNETKEALERQTATADILKVISSSPTDTQPVFDAIANSGVRLFGGMYVTLNMARGDVFDRVALAPSEARDTASDLFPMPLTDQSLAGRTMLSGELVHVHDLSTEAWLGERPREVFQRTGFRSALCAPMLREGKAIGAIIVFRGATGRFKDEQVSLLKTFADQAVIAIENVRLFNEIKEALEQQTATADILRVISGSPTDVQPVFDAVAESAARLCGAHDVVIRLVGPDGHYAVAHHGPIPVLPAHVVTSATPGGRAIIDARTVHIPDINEADVREEYPESPGIAAGQRTFLAVPLLREGKAIGLIVMRRLDVRPFTDKQIQLLETFAAQAVIAIENARLFKELQARNGELTASLEQQTAMAEILRIISSSPTDTQPVFDAIARSGVRLFKGTSVGLRLVKDDQLERVGFAMSSDSAVVDDFLRLPRPVDDHGFPGRAVLRNQVIHAADVFEEDWVNEETRDLARRMGMRACAAAPLVREGKALGAIIVNRGEPIDFTSKDIELLETFAAQAVIAIENVRLFKELAARNAEITEALEQQTATSEILRVISRSPTDIQPVFDAILENATRLCDAHMAVLRLYDGERFHRVAQRGFTPEFARWLLTESDNHGDHPESVSRQMIAAQRPIHILDHQESASYRSGDPPVVALVELGGVRTALGVPMQKEGRLVGAIMVNRREVRAFTQKQIDLVSTFADQAVIAIENVRLFKELQTRNAEVTESLEQQTATADILKVISSSPTDTQPVFDAVAESAARLCGAHDVVIRLVEGNEHRAVAHHGPIPVMPPFAVARANPGGRAIIEARTIHISDLTEAHVREDYPGRWPGAAGQRTFLGVPLVREDKAIGIIVLRRLEVRPFTDKQIQLLETFAAQAVIAIENVRLFKELEARTDSLARSVAQLTALGEVGQAISSTLDLETVLETIAARAIELSGQDAGVIYEYDPATEGFELRATQNFDAQGVAGLRAAAIRKSVGAVGTCVVTREPTQVPDTHAPDYPARLREILDRAGFRAVLAVPLLREDQIIGALMLIRKTPGPFSAEVVQLLETFASQSALAIQNARLFREIADKGRQLEVASRHKSDFLASMSHELRTPLNAILGFIELILDQIYGEVPADMQEPLNDIQASGKHLLRLINNVLDLAKIEAGRMELALTEYSVQDTVESVRQTLKPLAADKGLEFLATVPPDLPFAHGDPGRITQCLMNLAGNSLKFTKAGKVEISVEQQGERLVFRVADTGIGIAPDKIDSLFTEFKQTDATIAGEYGGTGLGLSISRKFVEMHGGRIWVESEPGRGSTFVFELPLRAGEPT